ncbi:TetR/AcrR family transcriptional regulator [Singulisphaera sp. PoT]|uniref:TetR/AcrR family transcriptional regulator n=1 Tax=Singulisphaera sp. PoT TaxID=3411797 RepID=UPI003BF4D44B
MAVVDPTRALTSEVALQIGEIAARLFATHGYDATSVRTIVEEAGVTKPTLYYYFGSKEGLAQTLLTLPVHCLNDRLSSILSESQDAIAMLVQTFEAHFEFSRRAPDIARFFFSLMFGPPVSGLQTDVEQFKGKSSCFMAAIANRAAEAGVIDPGRVESFLTACHGMIVISMLGFLYKGKDLEPDLAARLVDDLLRGFGTPETPDRGS